MCPGCSSDCKKQGTSCSNCSRSLDSSPGRETRTLWCSSTLLSEETDSHTIGAEDEDKIADYRDLIRLRVFDKVSQSRHLSASDVRTLFHECFAPQLCTCKSDSDRNPMCGSCTPVLTVMQLLAKNPSPLVASLAERAIPGRSLARNVYDRALLLSMLNEHALPLCANGPSCKGMLVNVPNNPKPLTSLISPESYNSFLLSRANPGEPELINPCCCILCLLFNQSAAVAQMVSPEGLHLEPQPSCPVYYFNVKLCPDVGLPEVCIDAYPGYLVNFQGSVGSYKPAFYYNWRDMLKLLHRDRTGNITFLPIN